MAPNQQQQQQPLQPQPRPRQHQRQRDLQVAQQPRANDNQAQPSLAWYHDLEWSVEKFESAPSLLEVVEVALKLSDGQQAALSIGSIGQLREVISKLERAI